MGPSKSEHTDVLPPRRYHALPRTLRWAKDRREVHPEPPVFAAQIRSFHFVELLFPRATASALAGGWLLNWRLQCPFDHPGSHKAAALDLLEQVAIASQVATTQDAFTFEIERACAHPDSS